MAQCFGKLLRSNFRFGRMFCSRTERKAGRLVAPACDLMEASRRRSRAVHGDAGGRAVFS